MARACLNRCLAHSLICPDACTRVNSSLTESKGILRDASNYAPIKRKRYANPITRAWHVCCPKLCMYAGKFREIGSISTLKKGGDSPPPPPFPEALREERNLRRKIEPKNCTQPIDNRNKTFGKELLWSSQPILIEANRGDLYVERNE